MKILLLLDTLIFATNVFNPLVIEHQITPKQLHPTELYLFFIIDEIKIIHGTRVSRKESMKIVQSIASDINRLLLESESTHRFIGLTHDFSSHISIKQTFPHFDN